MSLTPGGYFESLRQNPQISPETIARLQAKYHLDKPWYIQYCYWLKSAAQLDFGYSVQYKISATSLIFTRLWNTFILSFFALLIAWLIAVPLGIWAAVKRDTWVDRGCSFIAFIGLSVPDVLLALLALLFAASTGWFPVGGAQSALYDLMSPMQQFWDRAHHLILPALVLAAADLAGIMRKMRSNLLDTLRAEYVHRRARAWTRRRLGDLQTRIAQRH
ncbi:MAG: ABC transporter permease [Limisphaerales bacterium]